MSSRELSSVFISITGIFNLEIILITFVMLISLLFFNFLMTKQRLSLVMKQLKSLILSGISYIFSPNSIIMDFFPNLLIRFSLFSTKIYSPLSMIPILSAIVSASLI